MEATPSNAELFEATSLAKRLTELGADWSPPDGLEEYKQRYNELVDIVEQMGDLSRAYHARCELFNTTYHEKLAALKKDQESLAATMKAMETANSNAKETADQYKRDKESAAAAAAAEKQEFQKAMGQLNQKLEEMQDALLEKATDFQTSLEQQAAGHKAALQKEKDEHTQQLTSLKTKHAEAIQKIEKEQSDADKKAEADRSKAEKNFQGQRDKLVDQIAGLEGARDKAVGEIEEAKKEGRDKIEELHARCQEYHTQVEGLKTEASRHAKEVHDAKTARADKIENLQGEINDLRGEIDGFKDAEGRHTSEVQAAKDARRDQIDSLNTEITTLRDANDKFKEAQGMHETEMVKAKLDRSAEIDKLRTQLDSYKNKEAEHLSAVEAARAQGKDTINELHVKVADLRTQLEGYKDKEAEHLSAVEAARAEGKDTINQLHVKVEGLRTQLGKREAEQAKHEQQVRDAQSERSDEIYDLKNEIDGLKNEKIAAVTASNDTERELRAENARLDMVVSELGQEAKLADANFEAAQKEREQVLTHAHNAELDQLRTQLEGEQQGALEEQRAQLEAAQEKALEQQRAQLAEVHERELEQQNTLDKLELRAYEAESQTHNLKMQKKERGAAELRSDLQASQEEAATLKSSVDPLNEQIQQHQSEIHELYGEKHELGEDVERLEKQIADQAKIISDDLKEISELKADLLMLQAARDGDEENELENLKETQAAQAATIAQQEKTIEDLKTRRITKENLQAGLKTALDAREATTTTRREDSVKQLRSSIVEDLKKAGLTGEAIGARTVAALDEFRELQRSELEGILSSALSQLQLSDVVEDATTRVLSGVEDIVRRNQTSRPQLPLGGGFKSARPITDPALRSLFDAQHRFGAAQGNADDFDDDDEESADLRTGMQAVDIGARGRSNSFPGNTSMPWGASSSAPAAPGLGGVFGPPGFFTQQPIIHSRPTTSDGPPAQKKPATERVGQDAREAAFEEEQTPGAGSEQATADDPAAGGGPAESMEGKPLRIDISTPARIKNSVLSAVMRDSLKKKPDHIVRLVNRIVKDKKLVCWHVHGVSNTKSEAIPIWTKADFDNGIPCPVCLGKPDRQCFKITDKKFGFLLAATAQQHYDQRVKDMENDAKEGYE